MKMKHHVSIRVLYTALGIAIALYGATMEPLRKYFITPEFIVNYLIIEKEVKVPTLEIRYVDRIKYKTKIVRVIEQEVCRVVIRDVTRTIYTIHPNDFRLYVGAAPYLRVSGNKIQSVYDPSFGLGYSHNFGESSIGASAFSNKAAYLTIGQEF